MYSRRTAWIVQRAVSRTTQRRLHRLTKTAQRYSVSRTLSVVSTATCWNGTAEPNIPRGWDVGVDDDGG